jgi:hypothetical protein
VEIEWRIIEEKEEEKDGLRMKKVVVMEVLWWLWRLEELVRVVLVVVKVG